MESNDGRGSEDGPAILIVDDEADNRRIAGAILRAAGWRVDEADSGASAITTLARRGYALVLLDIQMPVLDGYRTAEAMRAGEGFGGSVPIMAFTALRDPAAIDRAFAAGMDGHVAKPFTPDGLVEAVRPWWPDGSGGTLDRLAALFGPAEIDGLLGRLAEQLAEALVLVPGSDDLRGHAHRLAGLAGTLGFAALSHHWLDVSEGDDAMIAAARVETRKALAELGRRRGVGAGA